MPFRSVLSIQEVCDWEGNKSFNQNSSNGKRKWWNTKRLIIFWKIFKTWQEASFYQQKICKNQRKSLKQENMANTTLKNTVLVKTYAVKRIELMIYSHRKSLAVRSWWHNRIQLKRHGHFKADRLDGVAEVVDYHVFKFYLMIVPT